MGTHPIFESDFDCLTEMSFQWVCVAVVLYIEIGISLLLCLPFISSKYWNALFKSGLAQKVADYSSGIFYVLLTILGLFCFDAYKDMKKYDLETDSLKTAEYNPGALNQMLMYKFRSQRNFYISGFALFLWVIIFRLTGLLKAKARATAEAEAARAQAKSASMTAELLLDQNAEREKKGEEAIEDETKELIADLKKRLESAQKKAQEEEKFAAKAKDDLDKKSAEVIAMKKQSENLAQEYDRLSGEFAKLQSESGAGDKKDE